MFKGLILLMVTFNIRSINVAYIFENVGFSVPDDIETKEEICYFIRDLDLYDIKIYLIRIYFDNYERSIEKLA